MAPSSQGLEPPRKPGRFTPFDVGADFTMDIEIGEDTLTKKRGILEEIAYCDTWGKGSDSFVAMIYERLVLMRDLLAKDGSIYVHCDWRVSSLIRLALDEILGADSFQREIIWRIGWLSGYKTQAKNWIRNHDTILFYTKDKNDFTFTRSFAACPSTTASPQSSSTSSSTLASFSSALR
jgi:hypothetical protein